MGAIVREISSLLQNDRYGLPALQCVDLSVEKFKRVRRISPTMAVKRKSTSLYKARLCARGDLLRPEVPMDYASPTVSRFAPEILLRIGVQMQWKCGLVDISSAFTQSSLLPSAERVIILPPPYVQLPFQNRIGPKYVAPHPPRLGLLTLRPLYGTSCAPLRWYATISSSFKLEGWSQMESDTCVFRLVKEGHWCGLAAIRVDDIFCTGNGAAWKSLQNILNKYDRAPIEFCLRGIV